MFCSAIEEVVPPNDHIPLPGWLGILEWSGERARAANGAKWSVFALHWSIARGKAVAFVYVCPLLAGYELLISWQILAV